MAGHFWLKLTSQMDPTVVQKAMWEQGLLNAMGKEAGPRTLTVGWKELRAQCPGRRRAEFAV